MSMDKIKSREVLKEVIDKFRSSKTIVFTNGCFDIIHRGHIEYLIYAKNLGDILVVGVNTDESVRRLKGSGRPLNKLEDRMVVLAALEMVDYVVPFNEDTPYDLISYLRPHVLVKGGDYGLEDVVGRDLVESYGGRVVIAPLFKGYSTSCLIRRMKGG
ncbi:MAG TPA: D-glycero-beta-D-manno-heptose 1-phosphate adenylyltransferase [Candidatus Hydrothermia bacterium]|nr:D-glycero-beta-D-manno-heptose 1-phosphate adenylyltransferase [Candidatus Hydrothermia bacterium]